VPQIKTLVLIIVCYDRYPILRFHQIVGSSTFHGSKDCLVMTVKSVNVNLTSLVFLSDTYFLNKVFKVVVLFLCLSSMGLKMKYQDLRLRVCKDKLGTYF
jgi:hypothetical protein